MHLLLSRVISPALTHCQESRENKLITDIHHTQAGTFRDGKRPENITFHVISVLVKWKWQWRLTIHLPIL